MHRELHVKLSVPFVLWHARSDARGLFFCPLREFESRCENLLPSKTFLCKVWRGVLWAVTGLGGAVPCPSALPRGWTKLRSEGAENSCLRSLRRIQRCPPTFDARGPRFYHVLERFLEKSWRQRVFGASEGGKLARREHRFAHGSARAVAMVLRVVCGASTLPMQA